MFRFQNPDSFWLLLLIPVIILAYLYFLSWKNSSMKRIGDPQLVKKLIIGKINGRLTTKIVLISLGLICIVTALANLQAGGHPEKVDRNGLDVMFVLDVSNSMLAQDVKPDRLTKAKELIYRTLEQLQNDRTGLVVFAGNAYLQVPLTVDFSAMRMLLAAVDPSMIPTQGTNFTDALNMANSAFGQNDKKNKVLILISDGEDHDEDAIETAKELSKAGVIIYTVGIGTPTGSTIYDPSTGKPMVDRQGNVVITKLNQDELRSIAEATGGHYQFLQNSGAVAQNLSGYIKQLGTKNLGTVTYTDYKSYFQYFLGVGLLLLLISWILPDARQESRSAGSLKFKKQLASIILLLTLGSISLFIPKNTFAQTKKPALSFKKDIRQGNESFNQGKYAPAAKIYESALRKDPNSFAGNFNLGDALYADGKYDPARNGFMKSLKAASGKEDKAEAYYNIGNSFMKQRNWQEAADAFKQSLLQNPNDRNTKYNLAYAQEMMKEDKKKNNKDNKNKQQQKKQQQQQKQQQQKQNQSGQQQNQPQQNKDQQKSGQQPANQSQMQPSKLTKQQADNILNALNQEEQALHKKKKQVHGVPVQPEDNW